MVSTQWRAVKKRFSDTAYGPRYRADNEDRGEFQEYGEWYTKVQRNGKAVLYVMTDYYIDAVLEAARAEEIEPPPDGLIPQVAIIVMNGNLHIGLVPMRMNASNVTAKIIINHVKSRTEPAADEPSLTLSTMPVIEPEIANEGVDNAKRSGKL